jgi:hypothetical protein
VKKSAPAPTPDAYVTALRGWHRDLVAQLRALVRASGTLEEVIKWRHLVYVSNGPVLLIRAEDARVLFGFWRGQRLQEIDARLTPGGKYEMATLVLTADSAIEPARVRKLVKAAIALNATLGDPTVVVR